MTTDVKVQLRQDHLKRLANQKSSLAAVAELIWKALDGDATTVDVHLDENALGAFAFELRDNGHGIPHKQAIEVFRNLGASWKKGSRSPGGRLLHEKAISGERTAVDEEGDEFHGAHVEI